MKRFILLVGLLGAIGALSACASVGVGVSHDGVDHERVAAVERAAVQTGVRVYWINLPRKAAAAGG